MLLPCTAVDVAKDVCQIIEDNEVIILCQVEGFEGCLIKVFEGEVANVPASEDKLGTQIRHMWESESDAGIEIVIVRQ